MSSAIFRLSRRFCTQIEITAPIPTTLKDRIKNLYQEQDHTKFVETFKQLSENRRFRGLNNTYKKTISRLASAKKFSLIQDLLEHHKKYDDINNEGFVIRLIYLYGKAGMPDHAYKLFDEMPCDRTVKSLNAVLNSYVQSNTIDDAVKILRELAANASIKPDCGCYNLVMEALCGKKEFDSAEELLDEMESNDVSPNVYTFNILLNGFYSNGKLVDGDRVWDRMEETGVEPDSVSFKWRFKGMLHAGKISDAVNFLDELKSRDSKYYVNAFNILVRWYCYAGNLDEAKAVYDRLKKSDCVTNEGTYQALIVCSCGKEDLDYSLELCRESVNARFGFCLIDIKVLQTLVDVLVKHSRVEEADGLLKLAYSIHPNPSKLKMPAT